MSNWTKDKVVQLPTTTVPAPGSVPCHCYLPWGLSPLVQPFNLSTVPYLSRGLSPPCLLRVARLSPSRIAHRGGIVVKYPP